MIGNFLTQDIGLLRNNPNTGSFSDLEDNYEEVLEFKGHIVSGSGKSNASKVNSGKLGFTITHRLYTECEDIMYGDRVNHRNRSYDVINIEHKWTPTSSINFYQVDLEVVI